MRERHGEEGVKEFVPTALPVAKRIARTFSSGAGFWSSRKKNERMPMVGWFDPAQLASTGVKTLFSMIVGERSDRRLMLALSSKENRFFDYTNHYSDTSNGPREDQDRKREELWLDFVCDTGDGTCPDGTVVHGSVLVDTLLRTEMNLGPQDQIFAFM